MTSHTYVIAYRYKHNGPSTDEWSLYAGPDDQHVTQYATRADAIDASNDEHWYHLPHNVYAIERRVMRADSRMARRLMRQS